MRNEMLLFILGALCFITFCIAATVTELGHAREETKRIIATNSLSATHP